MLARACRGQDKELRQLYRSSTNYTVPDKGGDPILCYNTYVDTFLASFLQVANKDGLLALDAWPPYVGGMLVGVLQLPLVLSMHETLGGSSSLIVMVSQVLVGPLRKLSPFACKFQRGFSHGWQVCCENWIIIKLFTG